MTWRTKERKFLEREKVTILSNNNKNKGKVSLTCGRISEDLSATIDTIVWFPELIMTSQRAAMIASFIRTYNSRQIDRGQPDCPLSSGGAFYSPPPSSQSQASHKRQRRPEPRFSPLRVCAAGTKLEPATPSQGPNDMRHRARAAWCVLDEPVRLRTGIVRKTTPPVCNESKTDDRAD